MKRRTEATDIGALQSSAVHAVRVPTYRMYRVWHCHVRARLDRLELDQVRGCSALFLHS